jgi:rhodanese-related sulfurtransferase
MMLLPANGRKSKKGNSMMNICGWRMISLVAVLMLLAACGRAETTPTPLSPTATPSAAAPADAQPSALLAASPNADGYIDVTVEQLAGLLPQKNFTLVNVHIPYEGELLQTDLFIPFDEMEENLDQLPAKDAPIVLYCRSGRMSTEAAAVLADLGYTNVYELDGGFNAWQAAGHELLQKQ